MRNIIDDEEEISTVLSGAAAGIDTVPDTLENIAATRISNMHFGDRLRRLEIEKGFGVDVRLYPAGVSQPRYQSLRIDLDAPIGILLYEQSLFLAEPWDSRQASEKEMMGRNKSRGGGCPPR